MERLTNEELRAIRERAEKATEGPWRINDSEHHEDNIVWGPKGAGYGAVCHVELDYPRKPRVNDAIFIAHAREDIPKLLAEIDRLRTYITGLTIHCVVCGEYHTPTFERNRGLYYCIDCGGDIE